MDKKLKILIISHYFPPMNSIASHRPYSWAKYWSKIGHDVTVLTSENNTTKVDLDLISKNFTIKTYKTLYSKVGSLRNNVKEVSINPKKNKMDLKKRLFSFLKSIHSYLGTLGVFTWDARMPNIVATGQRNAYQQVNEEWDLVVSTFAPYSTHQIAYRLKKNGLAKKWIADYRDLWTETHLYYGLFPFTLYEEYLENKINITADIITTVSEPLAKQIKEKYHLENVEVIENGFDLDDLDNIPKEKYWNDNKIRIIYTGSIYKDYQDPSPLFAAIQEISLSNEKKLLNDFEVLFAGGEKANLNELIDKYKVNRYVKYLGMLKRKEVLHMQRDATILLFLEFESEKTKGILTGKLFEYLASGTEIWVLGLDESSSVGQIIKKSNQGISFGKNIDLLKTKLIELLSRKVIRKNKVNSELLEYYSRKRLAEKMICLFEKKI
jgi:glycosyltransferase involved in cell wall biosynthesis